MDYIYWLIIILCYVICFTNIIYIFILAFSLFRDAPFLPSASKLLSEGIKWLDIQGSDHFVDIGSGDGKAVFLAAKLSKGVASYTGIEIDPTLVFLSKAFKSVNKYPQKITFVKSDIFEYNYKQFTKVYLFLTTSLASRIIPKMEKELPRGAVVVANMFGFGKEFEEGHKIERKEVTIGGRRFKLSKWIKE